MKTSVVLATYNGEKYIIQFLNSLRNQTRKIDEVIIFDDCSSDNTVTLIKEYIVQNRLENWYVTQNNKNLGWEKNFLNALLHATGDIIFPADQDDIWHIDKIEKMTRIFENNSDVWLLVSSFHAFCEHGGVNESVHDVHTENGKKYGKVVFDEKYYQILRPGCTMALRKDMLPIFNKLWVPDSPHDAMLWTIAALIGKLYLYDKPLIEYRRHEKNASLSISHNYKYKINEIERTQLINEWYMSSEYWNPDKKEIITQVNNWCDLRKKLLVEKKLIYWFKLFRFRNCYYTLKKYFGDLYYFIIG